MEHSCLHKYGLHKVMAKKKQKPTLEMWQFVCSVTWGPFCIRSDCAFSLAVWHSSYPFVHRTLLAGVTGTDISLTAFLPLTIPLSSSLHPSFCCLSTPYVSKLPTILGFVSTWVDMWGWKEDGDTGGKEEGRKKKPQGTWKLSPVDSEEHATVRELTNCQSADQG